MVHWHVGVCSRDGTAWGPPACYGAGLDIAAMEWVQTVFFALNGELTTGLAIDFMRYANELTKRLLAEGNAAGSFEVDGLQYWIQPVELERACST